MKIRFKEEPKEWRKSTLFTLLGLALVSSLMRWRRILPANEWIGVLALLGFVGVLAWCRPRWFRGYYRFSTRAGYYSSQFAVRIMLALLFVLVFVPLGWLLRLVGKDPLQLKRPANSKSYWVEAKETSPLDRLF